MQLSAQSAAAVGLAAVKLTAVRLVGSNQVSAVVGSAEQLGQQLGQRSSQVSTVIIILSYKIILCQILYCY